MRCVGAVVHDDEGRLLVVRRRNPPGAGRWSVPGGRVEPGESDEAALAREVLEETGLDVVVGRRLGTVDLDGEDGSTVLEAHDHLCTPVGDTTPRAGDDATEARWVDREGFDALDLVDGLAATLASWQVLPRTRRVPDQPGPPR